eukprot:1159579-Pelagomonas_calceolata.AAC.2
MQVNELPGHVCICGPKLHGQALQTNSIHLHSACIHQIRILLCAMVNSSLARTHTWCTIWFGCACPCQALPPEDRTATVLSRSTACLHTALCSKSLTFTRHLPFKEAHLTHTHTHGGHGGTSTWYGWHGIVDGGALGLVLLPGTCGSADLEGGFKDVWLFGAWKTAGGSCWMRVSLA